MKRIIPMICAVLLMTLLVFNSSAQSFGAEPPYRPVLDYTFYAEGYYCNAPVLVNGIQQTESNLVGPEDDLAGVNQIVQNFTTSSFDEFTQARGNIYYDFTDSITDGISFTPSYFSYHYAPFSIRYGDVFVWNDTNLVALTLLDNIGANFDWYGGSNDADVTISFNLRVYSVIQRNIDLQHNLIEYIPRTTLYNVSYVGRISDFVNSSKLSLEDLYITNETSGGIVPFSDFYEEVITSTSVMRGVYNQTVSDMYVDIEGLYCTIFATNAPFTGVIHENAPYIDVDGYDYFNGLFWDVNEGLYPFRQQRRGDYVSVMAANNLNKMILQNIDFDGDSNNPIIRIPSLFIRAVSDFFSIDFFGLGFTIGNVIGVFAMALMVVMFLRLFAGG